ncbi:MAG: cysteine synthase A [Coriobacteriales bacterium]|jgi:cysteine synthase A
MTVYRNACDLIGNTPLLELVGIERREGLKATLLAKLEYLNPAGSAKDRIGLSMIEAAEREGVLHPGATIIEPTSGNTGIGLAMVAAVKGYRLIITMPDTMSAERQRFMTAYGAEIELTDGSLGMAGAIARAEELEREIEGGIVLGQFVNPANPAVHEATTGPEIWRDTDGSVDAFVAGVGTGGTITGVARYLKGQNADIHIVAVEPASSPVLSKGVAGKHGIQGIGAGFIPETLDTSVYDEVVAVSDEDAMEAARAVGKLEGVLAGISGGAAVWAAVQVAKRSEFEGKTIVVLLPDGGDRYLSTELYA